MRRSLLTALSPRIFLATTAERVKTTLKKKNNTYKLFGTFEFESSTSLGAKHCDVVESESKYEFKNEY